MIQIKKTILTLALLITVATGAWAKAQWTGGTYTATANENRGAITVNGDATLTINSDVTVTVTGGINVASGTLTVKGPGTLVVTGVNMLGDDTGGVAISGNIIVQGGATVTATGGNGGNGGNGPQGGNGGNSLTGTMTSITNPSYGNIYVLNNGTYGVGFYKLKSTGTIGANKAYLTYDGSAGDREFFLFDEATGIEMPTVEDVNADAVVYDLQGRRVVNPTKGLYIVNGKKVFINK